MAKSFFPAFCLALLAIVFASFANSARLLDEVEPQDPLVVEPPATSSTIPPSTTLPSGQIPATPAVIAPTPTVNNNDDVVDQPLPEEEAESPATVAAPVADVAPVIPPVTVAAPIPAPTATVTSSTGPTTATVANPTGNPTTTETPQLSFFMHDILGGTQPSVRIVTGIISRTDVNGIPFSTPNNNFFPLQGGTPLPNLNNLNSLINPTTVPLITGLNPGQTNTVLQNSANNNNVVNGGNQPFVTAGQLPPGSIQKLMFGSITVIDDELTEGHELGSAVLGKAQGFYLASSLDGTSHTMAFTIILHGGDGHHDIVGDTISFFGVHRTASHESQIAVIGGTGKYENAKGYATVETIPQVDQHTTDGVDTVMHFTVYLS